MTADHPRRSWARLRDGLYRYSDSCIVYALQTTAGMIIFNAGTGDWLGAIDQLPAPPVCLVLTHFFRDHTAGAIPAAGRGIPVWAPYWEKEQLTDAPGLFARRETYIIYDNNWDLFAPVENVPVARWLQDWETLSVGDTELAILPTPGVSIGAITIVVRPKDSSKETGAFCGELIHSPGKVGRLAPLQYNYNDLDGAPNLLYSINRIREQKVDWLAGSTAPEIITDLSGALTRLEENLLFALRSRGEYEEQISSATTDALDRITPHIYQSRFGEASTYFLLSDSGKVLAVDYGYRRGLGWGGGYPFPRNRRPLLHGLEPLRRELQRDRIDAVLVTHFHDDHVNGIPLLQQIHGTKCFAAETFAPILEDPMAYAFPCTWPAPIRATSLPVDRTFAWEEYELSFHPISGHTRWATMISFAADEERIVATGDQFFFQDFDRPGTGPSAHNHVYRNGAMLHSITESAEILKRLDPTVILPGHGRAYRVPESFFSCVERYAKDYERIHHSLMPLAKEDVHFEVDSRNAWLVPYRSVVSAGTTLTLVAHVRNPYPRRETLVLRLILPRGWTTERVELELGPRDEGSHELSLTIPSGTTTRRQPIALDLSGPDRHFGQVAEALVTVGSGPF